jgi:flagellar motility protein MotE (MotC chaperone)
MLNALRPLRFVVILFACALMFLSSAVPAMAYGTDKSNPREGTAQLDEIQAKSERAAKEPPQSLKEVQSEAQKGYNEIQGDADLDKMSRPENSQDATTIQEKVEEILENVTGAK